MNKLFISLFMLACTVVIGQEAESRVSFGIKGGVNYSKYVWEFAQSNDENNLYMFNNTVGFYAGGFMELELSDALTLRPELLFSAQGSSIDIDFSGLNIFDQGDPRFNENVDGEKLRETSLLIPILLKWNASESFYLKAGPQISYRLNLNSDFLNESDEILPRFPNSDKFGVQLNAGAGYNPTDKLAIEGGYFFGLNYQDNLRIAAFQLGIAYGL